MSDFSFSATAECDICGKYLSSSDEECDHDGQEFGTYVFRRLERGRDTLVGVECVMSQVWYELEEEVGDDWIAYQLLGSKERVNDMLSSGWDSVSDIPRLAMATDAPNDVGE